MPELEAAVATRVYAITEPPETADPDYLHGLRASLGTALRYALTAIESGEQRAPDIPPSLLVQARLAARNGVGLDTVLRRYFTGYSLFAEFAIEEAEKEALIGGAALQQLLHGQSSLFDRLIEAVSEEYGREAASRCSSGEQRRVERVKRLLAGELIEASELNYDLDGFHLGMIVLGPGSAQVIRDLARRHDRSLLLVRPEDDTVWAWFGSRRRFQPADSARLCDSAISAVSSKLVFAFGEPTKGRQGWRLTHRQAKAALPFARRARQGVSRYREVALSASMLNDDLLTASLRELYLRPLARERDGGRAAGETLRAYFACQRSVSSAAAVLGVKRHTVTSRLRAIELTLGRSLSDCALEIEAALRLDEFEVSSGLRG